MGKTAPQRRLLNEGEFDSPSLIQYKITTAIDHGKQMEGWDIFTTTKEQNKLYGLGATASVIARFFEKDTAKEWALKADGDETTIRKWFDERFQIPCYLALVEYRYPEYENPDNDF